jgi:hypothetical protein
MPKDYFCSVSHFDFGVRRAADHSVSRSQGKVPLPAARVALGST